MKINSNLKYIALAVVSFAVTYGLMTGTVQKFVSFEDPLNEMFSAGLMAMLGIGSVFAAFEKSEK